MNFLVFNTDAVVLLDMIGIIRNNWPDAVVEPAMTMQEAKRAIDRFPTMDGAMFVMPVADFARTELPDLIERKSGKIFLAHFGRDDEENDIKQRGWVPLNIPFTDESVQKTILSVGFESR